MTDNVNHPKHYTGHPSGIECIQVTEHMNFCLGNAIKYLWRSDLKGGIEDLEKAKWYIEREIHNREKQSFVDKVFGDEDDQHRKVEITKLGESDD